MNRFLTICLAFLATGLFFPSVASDTDLNGGGGSAVYPVMTLWAQDYQRKTGIKVNYQSIGSGGGIRQTLARTIDFGNTDKPLPNAVLEKGNLVQFPILFIALVPVVNLPGIKPGEVFLDGPTLADIYLGHLKRWNDPAIKKLNPAVALPDLPIIVVHRADASGSTFNFTDYLSKVSPAWKNQVGVDTAVAWPLGSAGKGNSGLIATLVQAKGAIGYVEFAYALQNKLTYTGMINREGGRVLPDLASFQTAAEHADAAMVRDGSLILTDQPGKASWPLIAATYMLLHADAPADKNRAIVKFLDYGLRDGRSTAEQLHYLPLPEALVVQIEQSWSAKLHAWP